MADNEAAFGEEEARANKPLSRWAQEYHGGRFGGEDIHLFSYIHYTRTRILGDSSEIYFGLKMSVASLNRL